MPCVSTSFRSRRSSSVKFRVFTAARCCSLLLVAVLFGTTPNTRDTHTQGGDNGRAHAVPHGESSELGATAACRARPRRGHALPPDDASRWKTVRLLRMRAESNYLATLQRSGRDRVRTSIGRSRHDGPDRPRVQKRPATSSTDRQAASAHVTIFFWGAKNQECHAPPAGRRAGRRSSGRRAGRRSSSGRRAGRRSSRGTADVRTSARCGVVPTVPWETNPCTKGWNKIKTEIEKFVNNLTFTQGSTELQLPAETTFTVPITTTDKDQMGWSFAVSWSEDLW